MSDVCAYAYACTAVLYCTILLTYCYCYFYFYSQLQPQLPPFHQHRFSLLLTLLKTPSNIPLPLTNYQPLSTIIITLPAPAATMSSKWSAKPATDDLDDLFEGIDDKPTAKKPLKSKPVSAASKALKDQDILADLESQLSDMPTPSRPHTPRLKDTARRPATNTPPPPPSSSSADARKSSDSHRPAAHDSAAPSPMLRAAEHEHEHEPEHEPEPVQSSGGGGWWGLVAAASATASAAIKQAEQAVKEIQKNDEAMKWAEQVRGNVGALKGLGV